MDTDLAPQLLESMDCSISLSLFSGCLNVKTSNSSHSACSLHISLMEWCSTEDNTSVADLPAVEVLIELTISFIDSSVNDPHLIGLIVEVSSLTTKSTVVGGRIFDLD